MLQDGAKRSVYHRVWGKLHLPTHVRASPYMVAADGCCRSLPMAVADRPAASGGKSRCWYRRFLYRAHDCRGPGDGLHAAAAHNGQGILGGQRTQTRCGVGSVLQHPPRTRRTTGRTFEANVVSYSAVINACRMGGGLIVFSTRS